MTTSKKKPATKATKSNSVAEPATAVKTVKPSKKAIARATAAEAAAPAAELAAPVTAPKAEAPVAPTVAKALATQPVAAVQAPAAPRAEQVVAKAEAEQAMATQPLTIGMFQKRLYELGFYGGHWDGNYGPMTKQAVRRFQASQGLPTDGEPTPETLAALGF